MGIYFYAEIANGPVSKGGPGGKKYHKIEKNPFLCNSHHNSFLKFTRYTKFTYKKQFFIKNTCKNFFLMSNHPICNNFLIKLTLI